MVKLSSTKTFKNNGGIQARVSPKFHEELRKIRNSILSNTKIEQISFEEITNILNRHKLWVKIAEDSSNIKEEEIMQYGKH